MTEENCGNCRFGLEVGERTECHIRPPLKASDMWAEWPRVHFHDWCGEWEGKNTQVDAGICGDISEADSAYGIPAGLKCSFYKGHTGHHIGNGYSWEGKAEEPKKGEPREDEWCRATNEEHRWEFQDYTGRDVCRDCRMSRAPR